MASLGFPKNINRIKNMKRLHVSTLATWWTSTSKSSHCETHLTKWTAHSLPNQNYWNHSLNQCFHYTALIQCCFYLYQYQLLNPFLSFQASHLWASCCSYPWASPGQKWTNGGFVWSTIWPASRPLWAPFSTTYSWTTKEASTSMIPCSALTCLASALSTHWVR